MEGVGSRLGRASSRYGPTTTSFNGPVRKWEKKWVHVAQSSPSTASTPQSNGHNSPLLLRRWTPLAGDFAGAGAPAEEPPRRKFRYTPIAVIEDQKKVVEKKAETGKVGQSPAGLATFASNETDMKPIIADDKEADVKKETEVTENVARGSNSGDLNLVLGLEGPEDIESPDSVGETNEIQTEKASRSGFWSTEIEA